MRANIYIVPFLLILFSGCATRTRSLTLGGAGGVAAGAIAGMVKYAGPNSENRASNTLIGAGIGLGVGLLSAYLLHEHVEDRIGTIQYEQDERLRFGDLPPNPFSPANRLNRFQQSK